MAAAIPVNIQLTFPPIPPDFNPPPGGLPRTFLTSQDLVMFWKRIGFHYTDFTGVIAIRASTYNEMDAAAKAYVAYQFSLRSKTDVMYAQDGYNPHRFFLGPVSEFVRGNRMLFFVDGFTPISVVRNAEFKIEWGNENEAKARMSSLAVERAKEVAQAASKARSEAHIPRPPNAYILYRRDHHLSVKEDHPGVTNTQISQILGAAWKTEKPHVRLHYHRLSEEIKSALLRKYPNYVYKPRRSKQIQRRKKGVKASHQTDKTANNPNMNGDVALSSSQVHDEEWEYASLVDLQ